MDQKCDAMVRAHVDEHHVTHVLVCVTCHTRGSYDLCVYLKCVYRLLHSYMNLVSHQTVVYKYVKR